MTAQLTPQDHIILSTIASDWKLTPATLAYKLSRGQWIPSKHLLYISKLVAHAIAKGNGRLIISAPPRHGKSQLIDIYTPVWILERFPRFNVILASYGADLSENFARQARDIISDNQDALNVRLRRDSNRVSFFVTEDDGSMASVGLGGAITGRGAHVLLIDDYIKEYKEALSPTYRDTVWNWFVTTAYTRLEPGGTVIIIATRWHSDDLIGRILKNFPGQWQNIVLPAEAEANDVLGRQLGEPLFPERYPLESLHEKLEVLGSAFYQALYQQRPVDEAKKISDGAWLKVMQIVPPLSRLKTARIWDLAATEGGGDYTVGSLCGWDIQAGIFYIFNVVRRQIGSADVETIVRQTAISDGIDTEICIEQEPGSAGKSLCEHFQNTVLPEFKVTAIPTVTNKIVRAQPFLAGAEAGKVVLAEGSWNKAFIKEFDDFPGEYDDQIDTASAGYTKLTGKKVYSATWGRNLPKSSDQKILEPQQFRLTAGRGITWGRGSIYG